NSRHRNIATMIETLERILAQGGAPDATLKKLQAEFEVESRETILLQILRGHRARTHAFLEDIRDGNRPAQDLGSQGGRNWLQQKLPSSLLHHYPEWLHQMNQIVEAAKLPIHERAAKLTSLQAEIAKSGNPLAHDFFFRTHEDDQMGHAG